MVKVNFFATESQTGRQENKNIMPPNSIPGHKKISSIIHKLKGRTVEEKQNKITIC